ncbi:MAG: Cof-type HAD-IIB family hydrolase [Cetobacterium sp.]
MKSIALDLDGTLLNSEKNISEKNITTLKKMYNKGIEIYIVTGRMYSATESIIKKIDLPLIAICYNGAKVIDSKNNEVIFEETLSDEIVKILIEISRKRNGHLNLYQDEKWFVENNQNWQTDYYRKNIGLDAVQNNFDDFESYKMTKALFIDERVNLLEIEKEIKNRLGDRVHLTYSQERYLEVLNKDVNKGKTLKSILSQKNLLIENCIAFGDANNDKEMLTMAGFGVAMGNAEENLKKIAQFITDTNDNDGVSKFLESYI